MGAPLLHDDISSGFNLPYAMLSYVKLRSRVVLIVASAFLVFTFYTLSLASGSSANPVVDLGYARYVGQAGPNSVSQWLGVRYAAPPLGNLRFAEPQDPVATNRLHKAHKRGRKCLATGGNPGDWYTSEDCLFLNVFAPSNATAESKLPVLFSIGSGGFNVNSGSGEDGSGLVIASEFDVVVVTIHYRVGPYGFIAGNQIHDSNSASLNNGLKDQLKALHWVQDHISKFGGDPDHVTIGGHSAGAASVAYMLSAYGGVDDGLFHAAIAQSPSFGPTLTSEESQYQYDALVERTRCSKARDSLACLRRLPANELQTQNFNIPYPGAKNPPSDMYVPVIDGDLVRDSLYGAFDDGKFVRVPALLGATTNDGTTMVPRSTSNLLESDTFLFEQFFALDSTHFQSIHTLYHNTGNKSSDSGQFWRQLSDVYGDMRYMCPTMFISDAFSYYNVSTNWNYRYNVEDPILIEAGFGVPHSAEQKAVWSSRPDLLVEKTNGNSTDVSTDIVSIIQGYWTSFVRSYNPNTHRSPGSPEWEQWTRWDKATMSGQRRLVFETNTTTMEVMDPVVQNKCAYMSSIAIALQQ